MTVTTRQSGRIGYVTMDNPPVNAIGAAIRQGLIDAVDWANSNGFERVILTGAGRAFAAGADAKEFDTAPIEPHLPDVCQAIESSSVPWIAAISGVALGGALELAMACRTRIAPPNAQLGLPEVALGVVPGAGGTQRLPRLVGFAKAIEMIGTGKPVSLRILSRCEVRLSSVCNRTAAIAVPVSAILSSSEDNHCASAARPLSRCSFKSFARCESAFSYRVTRPACDGSNA